MLSPAAVGIIRPCGLVIKFSVFIIFSHSLKVADVLPGFRLTLTTDQSCFGRRYLRGLIREYRSSWFGRL